MKNVAVTLGIAVALTTAGCATLSSPVTQREQTAAAGGLAGGAGGAIIGSLAGGAVAGGLFGIPIGAAAGWLAGDYMEREGRANRARIDDREAELDRLRRENQRLKNENGARPSGGAQSSSQQSQESRGAIKPAPVAEEIITSPPRQAAESETPATTTRDQTNAQPGQRTRLQQPAMGPAQLRQAQRRLNDLGFNAGQVDGVWGPNTQAAIRNFQQAKDLEATGRLNEETIDALGIASAGVENSQQPQRQK